MRIQVTGRLFAALLLTAMASAHSHAAAGEKPKSAPLYEDINNVPSAQKDITEDAQKGNKNASTRANTLGIEEIVKGLRDIRVGRVTGEMPEVQVGRVEVVQGILGLLAGKQAKKLSDKNDANAEKLAAVAPAPFSAASAAESSGDSSGASSAGKSAGQQDVPGLVTSNLADSAVAELLKDNNPKLNEALASLEEDFGFTREKFLESLAKGVDPKELFTKADKNAMTAEQYAMAMKSAGKKHAPKAESVTAQAEETSHAAPAATTAESSSPVKLSGFSGLRDKLARGLGDEDDTELSPEVKAALAERDARELAERRRLNGPEEFDLFTVVHLKYRERENHLRWGEPLRTAEVER